MKKELGLLPRDQHATENTRAGGHLQAHTSYRTSVVGGVAVQQGVLVATQSHLCLATVGVGHLHLQLTAWAVQDAVDGAIADALAPSVVQHLFELGYEEVVPAGRLELIEQIYRRRSPLAEDVHPATDFLAITEFADLGMNPIELTC